MIKYTTQIFLERHTLAPRLTLLEGDQIRIHGLEDIELTVEEAMLLVSQLRHMIDHIENERHKEHMKELCNRPLPLDTV